MQVFLDNMYIRNYVYMQCYQCQLNRIIYASACKKVSYMYVGVCMYVY